MKFFAAGILKGDKSYPQLPIINCTETPFKDLDDNEKDVNEK